jgi:FkbM family methyltransferase
MRTLVKKMVLRELERRGYSVVPKLQADKYTFMRAQNIRTVFDIGANDGGFATDIRSALPDAMIYSFEPLVSVYSNLLKNRRQDQRFKAFNCALGQTSETRVMYHNGFSPASSLLPMHQNHFDAFPLYSREQREETISIRCLDEVAEECHLEANILVKMDVQGFEDQVIAGGNEILARSHMLILEVSFQTLYEGQPLFYDVDALLRARGFRYVGNWDQLLSMTDGSVISADAIYLRA